MRIVRPSHYHAGARRAVEAAHMVDGMQLERVVDDFSLAFRQREIAARAWSEEHRQFVDTTARVIEAIDHGFLDWLGSAALLLDPHNDPTSAKPAALSDDLRLPVLRLLLGQQALAYWLRARQKPAPDERPELSLIVNRAKRFMQPYFAAAGSELGVSESLPGVTVHGCAEAVLHLLLNVLVDVLAQAAIPQCFTLAMCKTAGGVRLSLQMGSTLFKNEAVNRRWCLDACSQGLRLAADIARDQNLRCEWLPERGTLAEIEFAVAGGVQSG